MGNTQTSGVENDTVSNTFYEIVDMDKNEKIKNEYNELKENHQMLNNDFYSKKCEIADLKKQLEESNKKNIELQEEIKGSHYLHDVLEIKIKNQINDYNKLKDNYDNLEYTKLDIEEKYLQELDNKDCINYLKEKNEVLEIDLNKQIVKYNDEKNLNNILGENLCDMTKNYDKYKQLYNQSIIDKNTIKSNHDQYKKNYKTLLKKNELMLENISINLNSKLFKKKLYELLENIFSTEPYVYNEIIEHIIKVILSNILLEKMKIN
jgi:chromosome segregation ATPase